jgi:hypothetical protein
MEGRLYELIRDYQTDRAATVGDGVRDFRVAALHRFAVAHPERYPEYIFEDGRLNRSIAQACEAGEILPAGAGQLDEPLVLRMDRDRAP